MRLLAPTLAVIIAGACSNFHPTDVKNPNLTDQQFLNTPAAGARGCVGHSVSF